MKEGAFNLNLQKAILRRGIFCYKTADRFHPGVPDLYIAGGNWVESKVVKVGSQNRMINMYKKMTEEQHTFCQNLMHSGDRVIFCARIEAPKSKYLMLVPYPVLANVQSWSTNNLRQFPKIENEKDYNVDHVFQKWGTHVDIDWYHRRK